MSAALDDFLALAYAAALGISPGPVNQSPPPMERPQTTLSESSRGVSPVTERIMLNEQRKTPLEWNMPSTVR